MSRTDARERIILAAARLLDEGGAEALSTRAVSTAAGVQAPTLYRLFGDKDGLLDAVAVHGFQRFLTEKQALEPTGDPVEDLRTGWDNHIRFGLAHPSFYSLMYGTVRPGHRSAAADEAHSLLLGLLRAIADSGRLRVPPEPAAAMIESAASGATLYLLTRPEADRDPAFATRLCDAIISAVTISRDDQGEPSSDLAVLAARALSLEAALAASGDRRHSDSPLTAAETALLRDWLRRLAESAPS
ncbi:TetR/AcrR family transcriptional regulator [Yinghuangia sp. YIM S10712]|uniref:TetR/AcrR family transcriptional regulator n=1 Tax=Yinghuangia sp. YIM S10712 TaxID=3436930 RepID=UPI003F53CB68